MTSEPRMEFVTNYVRDPRIVMRAFGRCLFQTETFHGEILHVGIEVYFHQHVLCPGTIKNFQLFVAQCVVEQFVRLGKGMVRGKQVVVCFFDRFSNNRRQYVRVAHVSFPADVAPLPFFIAT